MRISAVCYLLSVVFAVGNANAVTTRGGATATATRAATRAPVARSAAVAPVRQTAARSAVSIASMPGVAARSATTQKVINTNTTIAAAKTNTIVSDACRAKFDGCMDAFCMLDSTSGGRCLCSDKNKELGAALSAIERLDAKSYDIATKGVERIEMGQNADAVIAAADAASKSLDTTQTAQKRKALDLSIWDAKYFDTEELDIFSSEQSDPLEGKEGDVLYRSATDLCREQMPECAGEFQIMAMLYGQQVKSDCTAYENDLKKRTVVSETKLRAAEQELRAAALEQFQSANKWDLGQCTTQFKTCMATTAGCGNDFAGCATISAMNATNITKSNSRGAQSHMIKGAISSISISASTYDAIMSKKVMCDNITNSCVAVKDQVWDAFLREVAPQLKSAELIAEDNVRQDCIGNISSCFLKACKDTMDPNNPDGSYDICLGNPKTMLNVCKVPLNACGIDTNRVEDNDIWAFVTARLAASRVDACTTQVKGLLQRDTMCGEDLSQCVGLTANDVLSLINSDSLTACYKDGELQTTTDIREMISGILLSVDTAMLAQCNKAVDEALLDICGDTVTCDAAFENDEVIGTASLTSTREGTTNDYVISGLISFANLVPDVNVDSNTFIKYGISDEAIEGISQGRANVTSALNSIKTKIDQRINSLVADETVRMCTEGRDMRNINGSIGRSGADSDSVRYPHITDGAMVMIINAGLDKAISNYDKKYTELVAEAMKNQSNEIKAATCAAMATDLNARQCKINDIVTEVSYGVFSREITQKEVCKEYENVENPLATAFNFGMGSADGKEVRISSVGIQKLIEIASVGKSKYVEKDEDGNIISYILMTSAYSGENSTCTITKTTTVCEGTQLSSTEVCSGSKCIKKGTVVIPSDLDSSCTQYSEPVTEVQTIKM